LPAEIVELCGLLPLAIRIAAARLVAGGGSGRRLHDRLAAETARLAALDDGERSVAAAFAVSYDALPADQRRLFGLLALHPATAIDVSAVEALAGAGPGEVDVLLDRLHDAHLITLDADGFVELHDLMRAFAARYALPEIEVADRKSAVDRLVDHAAGLLVAANELTEPHRFRPPVDCPRPKAVPFDDADSALGWLRAQWPALAGVVELAGEYGSYRRCWQLAFVLRAFFFRDRLFEPWLRTHRCALDAAETVGDAAAAGMILNNLGMAHVESGELDEAFECHQRAHGRFAESGDERGATDALSSLAWVRLYQGDPEAALRDLTSALGRSRATTNAPARSPAWVTWPPPAVTHVRPRATGPPRTPPGPTSCSASSARPERGQRPGRDDGGRGLSASGAGAAAVAAGPGAVPPPGCGVPAAVAAAGRGAAGAASAAGTPAAGRRGHGAAGVAQARGGGSTPRAPRSRPPAAPWRSRPG
jgi:hypothetical protein